jgi:hypothetical protein
LLLRGAPGRTPDGEVRIHTRHSFDHRVSASDTETVLTNEVRTCSVSFNDYRRVESDPESAERNAGKISSMSAIVFLPQEVIHELKDGGLTGSIISVEDQQRGTGPAS